MGPKCFYASSQTHIYLRFHYTTIPQGNIRFFVYIPGVIRTMQHLTDTLAFIDHWQHDLHHFAERSLFFITIY